MGKLTTHILDTANGKPAAGVAIELFRVSESQRNECLAAMISNSDGRCDSALLEGDAFTAGIYELHFHVGNYFLTQKEGTQGTTLYDPPFLNTVIIRVGLADAQSHYHVPLLVSPWSYSTYRGS